MRAKSRVRWISFEILTRLRLVVLPGKDLTDEVEKSFPFLADLKVG